MTLTHEPWLEDTMATSFGAIWEPGADELNTTHRDKLASWSTAVEFFFFFKTDKQERSSVFKNQPISLL